MAPDLTLQTLLDRGLPYARIDRWARTGHLKPDHDGGTGNNRHWPQQELQVAAVMWQLVEGGLAAGVAALMARRAVTTGHPVVLAPGVTLTIDIPQITGGTP
jgi:hypothetical protein